MNRAILIAVMAFLIYGVQVSEQQYCTNKFCAHQSNTCGCNGCCYGIGKVHGGRCVGGKCRCWIKILGPPSFAKNKEEEEPAE